MTRDPQSDDSYELEPSVSIAQILRTLRRYRHVLLLSFAVAICLVVIGSLAVWLSAPARYITSLPFQLEFEGAEQGRFPNGTQFSAQEVVATSVLANVYRANNLSEFMTFQQFRDSVFVLESNDALEKLAREYRAKLSDPKLSPVDRERLEREFQQKQESLAKDSYSINYMAEDRAGQLPSSVRAKVLQDILQTWANYSVQKKGVALYDLSVLSSGIFDRKSLERHDYVIALDMLRVKIEHVIRNIDQLAGLPGAKVVRTPKERLSLAELRVQLEDEIKFRIEPLVGMILSKRLSRDPQGSISFLESRLRFNELEQKEAETRVVAMRDSITTYIQPHSVRNETSRSGTGDAGGQIVIPQLDESFFDRMLAMSGEQNDLAYRQKLVDKMREESLAVVPLAAEANYYRSLLEGLRGFESGARPARADEQALIETEIDATIVEAIHATDLVNQLYSEISKGLTPSTLLYSTSVPPSSRVERATDFGRLVLYSILIVLFAMFASIVGILLHARMARPAAEEEAGADEHPTAPTAPVAREGSI